jgi:long-chain acyl-CoA synthetase
MEHTWFNFYDPQTPHSLSYPDQTLDRFLYDTAAKYPSQPAVNFILKYILGERVTIGGKLSYGRLAEAVDRFAAGLSELGVRKEDRVAIMLPNCPQYIVAFFAAVRLGAIVVNTNPTYTGREIKHQMIDSGAETIILLNLFLPRLREVQADIPQLKHVIVTNIYDMLPFPSSVLVRAAQKKTPEWVEIDMDAKTQLFNDLLARSRAAAPQVERSSSDVALFQYTGGTTGLPKAAMLTHRNIVANTLQIRAWLPDAVPAGERLMAAIPFFHVYGMTVAMFFSVALAAEMLIVPNPRPIGNVMNIIHKERASIFPGVPAMYIGIINHPEVEKYDLKSVRACISGSAPLPMEVQERFGTITGGRLVEGYGLTEAAPVTHANPVYGERRSGSIGIPLPDVEARVIDIESGAEIPFGAEQTGELLVRGPQVMAGYWNRPEETAQTIDAEGWLHTGDIVRTDADGFFYIVDRKKDMINVSGYKVLPREVEEVLFMHPKVLEAVVAGVPNERTTEIVKAYIVLKEGEQLTEAEVEEFCRQNLAPYKVPRRVEFRGELPKTAVGKVLRRVLVEEERQKLAEQQKVEA